MKTVLAPQTQYFSLTNPFHEDVEVLSFDIWNTLLTRNPEFSRKRDETLRDHIMPIGYREKERGRELMHVAVKTANLLVDAIQETQGTQIGPEERIYVIVDQVNVLLGLDHDGKQDYEYYPVLMADIDVPEIMNKVNVLFQENLPTMIDFRMPDVIQFYRHLMPVAFVSNTGLISGAQMREALPKLGLVADHYVFSDEIGVAKPNAAMFARLKELTRVEKLENILHIGDNLVADILGADQEGFSTLYVDINAKEVYHEEEWQVAWQEPGKPVTIKHLGNLEKVIRAHKNCFKPELPYERF